MKTMKSEGADCTVIWGDNLTARRRGWNNGSKAAVFTAYLRKSEEGQGGQISLEGTAFSAMRLEGFKQRHDVI